MFERIFDWIDRGWGYLKPFYIVDAWEKAAVLRLGRFHRESGPGFHWKIPFVDIPHDVTSCVTTVRLPSQALTTKDDVQVSLAAIVKYEVVALEPYITAIFDQHDVLCDVTMGAIRRQVAENNYHDLVGGTLPEEKVATTVRRAAGKYGFKVHEVTFTGFTKARPLMLLSQSVIKDLDN